MISIEFTTLTRIMNKIHRGLSYAKAYIFSLVSSYGMKRIDTTWKHKECTLAHLSAIKQGVKNGKYIYTITTPEKLVLETDNMRAFCRKFKLHQPSMTQVANGNKSGYKGFSVSRVAI